MAPGCDTSPSPIGEPATRSPALDGGLWLKARGVFQGVGDEADDPRAYEGIDQTSRTGAVTYAIQAGLL